MSATKSPAAAIDRRGFHIGRWLVGLGKRLGGVAAGAEGPMRVNSQEQATATAAPKCRRPERLQPVRVNVAWQWPVVDFWQPKPDFGAWPPVSISSHVEPAESGEQTAHVRQLIKEALEANTSEELVRFLAFTTHFRRLSVWNARMAYIQRPGARVIASEHEWRTVERTVAPDAVPIIILWPFCPIRLVYEIEDTLPTIDRAETHDPFAAEGKLAPVALTRLIKALRSQKRFQVAVEPRRLGHGLAGSAATQGELFNPEECVEVASDTTLGSFASEHATTGLRKVEKGTPLYRVQINDRLTLPEQFVTLAHELAHIFCGHLGGCHGGGNREEESGWPDRRHLGKAEREVEAEAVAYVAASRAGIVSRSADYLAGYVKDADLTKIDVDLVVRAAARIERLGKIHYGRMDFGR